MASRFGLGGANELTLERIGRVMGITKERVRQIESRAHNKLREFAEREEFFGMISILRLTQDQLRPHLHARRNHLILM